MNKPKELSAERLQQMSDEGGYWHWELLSHIAALDEEIDVLKQRAMTPEHLVASTKEWAGQLLTVCKERDQLRAENEKQAARIAELEAGLMYAQGVLRGGSFEGGVFWRENADAEIQELLSPKDTQGDK